MRGARTGTLIKAAKSYDLDAKWKKSPVCQKMERFTKRAQLTDFERFKVMVARGQRSFLVKRLTAKAMGKKATKGKAAPKAAPAKAPAAAKGKKAKK